MSRIVVTIVLAALLAPAPAHAQTEKSDFAALAKATCSPLPACAIPERGTITCPGGEELPLSLMPPWCADGSRTRVRDRVMVLTVVQTTDPRVAGTYTLRVNMNLDSSTFSGPIWGTCTLEVPGRGSWEGMWEGQARDWLWTYKMVLHGSREFEGLQIRAVGVRQKSGGVQLTGVISDPGGR